MSEAHDRDDTKPRAPPLPSSPLLVYPPDRADTRGVKNRESSPERGDSSNLPSRADEDMPREGGWSDGARSQPSPAPRGREKKR